MFVYTFKISLSLLLLWYLFHAQAIAVFATFIPYKSHRIVTAA